MTHRHVTAPPNATPTLKYVSRVLIYFPAAHSLVIKLRRKHPGNPLWLSHRAFYFAGGE